MISIWWIIPAMLAGAVLGILIIALVSANDTDRKGKWWNDGNL